MSSENATILPAPPGRTEHDTAPTAEQATNIAFAIWAGFKDAVGEEIQSAHRQGLPVPVAAADGPPEQVAWLHPDGEIRPDKEPVHPPVHH